MGLPGKKLENIITPVPSDIEVAQAATPLRIAQVLEQCKISMDDYEPYGHYKAKISDKISKNMTEENKGHYVVVAGITPPPLGEWKSTTTFCSAITKAVLPVVFRNDASSSHRFWMCTSRALCVVIKWCK